MAHYIVNTIIDSKEDDLLSLQEAVALSNKHKGADRISFSDDVRYIQLSEELEISGRQKLSIQGDKDNDGISDVTLYGGYSHHFTVEKFAKLSLTGIDLFNGQGEGVKGADGKDGAAGKDGEAGFGLEFINFGDRPLELRRNHGRDGDDGEDGTKGGDGADGDDGIVSAGSIVNYGTLKLVRVGFGDNDANGAPGGNGGLGGNGGHGGAGGSGIYGRTYKYNDVLQPGQSYDTSGGNGGHGGDGGHAGHGGDGGNGGAAAGAIYNAKGAVVTMQDVAFGGILPSIAIYDGNSAKGGLGGNPGSGGNGGAGNQGGDGGFVGYFRPDSDPVYLNFGTSGNGGNGGDAGLGGDAGAYGDSGDAAGAILNEGTIAGVVAFAGNSADTFDMSGKAVGDDFGLAGLYGRAGKGAPEDWKTGNRSNNAPAGTDGLDGIGAADGLGRLASASGEVKDDILYLDGSKGAIDSAGILVYGHGVDLTANEDAGERQVSFNVIRIGGVTGTVSVDWFVRPTGVSGVNKNDFEGGKLPSGTVKFAPPDSDASYHLGAVKTVAFEIADDPFKESAEGFEIVLRNATVKGEDIVLGTSVLSGKIQKSGPVGPTKGDDTLSGSKGNDRVNLLAGNDVYSGAGGNDTVKGGNGHDSILGGNGNDKLVGNQGKDRLDGGAGKDLLDGGPGNDTLIGGGGRDTFLFSNGSGLDKILDFQDNVDLLDLTGLGLSSVKEALSYAKNTSSGDVRFDFGDGDVLVVLDLQKASLSDDILV